jgi:uncharacterized protein (TIGR03067 family)
MSRMLLAFVLMFGLGSGTFSADAPAPTLDGVWEITGLIDDGEMVPPAKVREGLAKDGKLTITGQTIKLVRPRNNETATLLFVTDPKANPMTIDLAGTDRVGSKGILMMTGDSILLCLNEPGNDDRPREFSSKEGSHVIFMTLKRSTPQTNTPTPNAPTATNTTNDDNTKKLLLGTWGHQDEDKVELGTFNSDGSFAMVRTWKKGWRKLIENDSRASGEWSVRDGVLIVKIKASTDNEINNQVYSYKINSINDKDLFLQAPDGKIRREWKTQK